VKKYVLLAVLVVCAAAGAARLFDGPDPPPECLPVVGCPAS